MDEHVSDAHRFGFGYGTLPDPVERDEERFMIEWHHSDDSMCHDLLAFSRPKNLLLCLGYPVVRQLQRCFSRDSKVAILRAVA